MDRNVIIDIMKAITIILVIIGHCKIPSYMRDFIFSFHMPLFFIIGGYFYKASQFGQIVRKSAKRLLVPYLITGVITSILLFIGGNPPSAIVSAIGILFGNNGSPEAMYKMPMTGPIWFLLALFWCRIIFNYLYSKTKYWLTCCIVLSPVSSLFGYYIINPPLGILIGMSALVFYALGKKIQEYGLNRRMVILLVVTWLIAIKYSRLEMAIYLYELYPLCVIGSFGGVISLYYISLFVKERLSFFTNTLLFVGKNTLLILCYHHVLWRFMPFILKHVPDYDIIIVILFNIIVPLFMMYLHLKVKEMLVRKVTISDYK